MAYCTFQKPHKEADSYFKHTTLMTDFAWRGMQNRALPCPTYFCKCFHIFFSCRPFPDLLPIVAGFYFASSWKSDNKQVDTVYMQKTTRQYVHKHGAFAMC